MVTAVSCSSQGLQWWCCLRRRGADMVNHGGAGGFTRYRELYGIALAHRKLRLRITFRAVVEVDHILVRDGIPPPRFAENKMMNADCCGLRFLRARRCLQKRHLPATRHLVPRRSNRQALRTQAPANHASSASTGCAVRINGRVALPSLR